ncbi:MAG TPA: 2Fe-2S iron-sulfur cluster-binding protein [Pyrinomonadaceae bacterium]|nr:(2Fe-2S)-binding protein [Acidobacteriota bacterium]HQZ98522.1 2Fe-2S iron-sulfur cluster-binding protein [Pyrinomonadaceae bacterium]
MDINDIKDVFQPYDRLVEIEICGEKREVPENNTLLRCFQYLAVDSISYGDFCWNGECLNCQVWIDNGGKEKALIACRTNVAEGMNILRMAEYIDLTNE